MDHAAQTRPRSIDLTGLPEEAIRAIESLAALLRKQAAKNGGSQPYASREEWVEAIRAWAFSHAPQGSDADWSRESIYSDRGE
jgi:hypothetical protein